MESPFGGRAFFGWLFVCAAFFGPLLRAQDEALAPDSRIRFGQLPNGFRYEIFPRATPNQVSFRLVVKVGSIDEEEAERGLAHFVEHMVFNGTKHYPRGTLEKLLRENGLSIGADANADTHYGYTNYRFDLESADRATLLLHLLRDFADQATFERGAVDAERNIVLAEMRMRDSSEYRVWQERHSTSLRGSILAEREPIGLKTVIDTVKPDQLRKFYRRFYRPENMVLIVVGGVDADVIEKQIREAFSDFVNATPPRPRAPVTFPAEPTWRVGVTRSDLRSGSVLALIADTVVTPVRTGRAQRTIFFKILAQEMFKLRLERLAEAEPKKLSLCDADPADESGMTREFICEISPRDAKLPETEARLVAELHASLEQGFTPEEIEEMGQVVLRGAADQLAQEAGATNAEKANRLISLELNDATPRAMSQTMEDLQRYVSEATPQAVLAAWREVWGGWRTAWLLLGREFTEKASPADLLALVEKTNAAPVLARAPAPEFKFPYDHFGPGGEVQSRRRLDSLDTDEMVFRNGLRLMIKKTELSPNTANMVLRVGNGRLSEPLDRPGLGLLGSFWIIGGLKQMPWSELSKVFLLHPGNFTVAVDSAALTVSTTIAPRHLLAYQQVLAAYLTDAAFEKDRFPLVVQELWSKQTQSWDGPQGILEEEVGPLEHKGDSRYFSPRRQEVIRYTVDEVKTWLSNYLRNSDVTLIVVGDVNVAEVVDDVSKTLGSISLPATQSSPLRASSAAEIAPAKHPEHPAEISWPTWTEKPSQTTYTFETNSQMSVVCVDWPVRDAMDAKERAEAKLLSEIMTERARTQIRQERGQSYVTEFQAKFLPGPRDGGWIRFFSDCKATDIESIVNESANLIKNFRTRGITPSELARAKSVLLATAEAERRKNDFWTDLLSDRVLDPASADRTLEFPEQVRKARARDVDEFGQKYLRLDTAFVTRIIAQPPKKK